jgi:hypothetical protein
MKTTMDMKIICTVLMTTYGEKRKRKRRTKLLVTEKQKNTPKQHGPAGRSLELELKETLGEADVAGQRML